MVKVETLLGIAVLGGVAIYAVNKFSGNAEVRQAGQTARVADRQEEKSVRTDARQEEKTNRTEARWEAIKDILTPDKTKTSASAGTSTRKSIRVSTNSNNITVKQATPTVTTKSTNSPFITSGSAAANMSTSDGKSVYVPAPKITSSTPYYSPIARSSLLQKFLGR